MKNEFKLDFHRWCHIKNMPYTFHSFWYLFITYPEFRTVFYYRLKQIGIWGKLAGRILNVFFRGQTNCYLYTKRIGGGVYIQHGFATIITATSIGKNVWINQQVTVGHKGNLSPVIGDNVRISCGAKVLGGVTIGNNVIIGANAVVVKDVPDNCIVAGVPAKIIRYITENDLNTP